MSTPKLWVPPRADKEAHFFCRICGTQFITEKAMEYHVVKCGDDDTVAELRAMRPQNQPFFEMPDPEWEAYNEGLRRRGINPEIQFQRRGKKPLKES